MAAKIKSEAVALKVGQVDTARRELGRIMADNRALELDVRELYFNSRRWRGFQTAFDSWEQATWRWADAGTMEQQPQWRQYLLHHRHLLPPEPGTVAPVDELGVERALQTYLLHRTVFLGHPANRQKHEPGWWKRQSAMLYLAGQLNDDEVFKRIVLLLRNPDVATGNRDLLDWLRMFWAPGCLWAFTNNGISALINRYSENSGSYSEGSIKNAIASLKLWRPTKPLYWGLDKDNGIVQMR